LHADEGGLCDQLQLAEWILEVVNVPFCIHSSQNFLSCHLLVEYFTVDVLFIVLIGQLIRWTL